MKKIYSVLIFLLLSSTFAYNTFAQVVRPGGSPQRSCPTFELMDQEFQNNSESRARYESVQAQLNNILAHKDPQNSVNPEVIYNIPVVVHILLPAAQQSLVTDAIVMSQLNTLNFFYGNQPVGDSLNVYEPFRTTYGRAGLNFCLAQKQPDGSATTGINRITYSGTFSSGGTHPGTVVVWDPTKYMNIWVCVMTGGILGYSYLPGTWTPSNYHNGFVNDYRAFGTGPGTSSGGYHYNEYNLGMTAVHEIGHFFNLQHTWGPNNSGNPSCNLSDQCADTPPTVGPYFGCTTTGPVTNACSPSAPGIMWQNHMDYADDACMKLFTNDQCARIIGSLSSPDRVGLITSDACVASSGFTFNATTSATVTCGVTTAPSVTLASTSNGGFSTPITLAATAGVPAGTTVSFGSNPLTPGSSTTVTLNNANTLINGTYDITVTGTAGSIVQTATVTFIVSGGSAPSISSGPANQSVCVPATATFAVTTSGAAVTSYQWQVNTGGGFANISGATTASYTTPATTASMNGYQYRVIVNGQCASGTSVIATLNTSGTPAISTQPANTTVCSGTDAVFSIVASGTGLSYQWQVNTGSGFNNISGANSSSYTVTAVTLGQSGYQYQVIVSSTCGGPVTSNPATLSVGNSAAITGEPSNLVVCVGAAANFTVAATGSSLTYQWQVNTGSGFTDIPGATASTYNAGPATAAQNGYQYRVNVFSCTPTPLVSNTATLTVNVPASITTQASSTAVCEGTNASFSVAAQGTSLGYQWQVSTTGCGGTFANISGATTNTLTVSSVTTAQNGYAYRVIVNNSCNEVTSNCATLTVNSPIVVTTQPASTSVCLPTTTASFSVAVTGTAPAYQWQVNTGSGFTNISGANTATLNLTGLTASMNGYQYRVVLSGTCSNSFNSNAVTLTVNSPVAITDQPDDVSICEGSNASFSVTATGSTITYQWQSRRNGGPFANVSNGAPYSGATTATLTITNATSALSGYEYRVIVSGVPCGAVNSDTVLLTVNELPGVVLVAAEDNHLTPYNPSGLYSTVSPPGTYTYVWYRDGAVVPGQTASSIAPVTVDWFGDYQVQVTDVNGCSKMSNLVKLSDSVSNLLFIYPNPSRGIFQVRYYSSSTTEFSLNVYDSKGARVWSKKYPISARYEQMLVDLGRNAQGTYLVEVKGSNGKRLASGKAVISR